MAGLPKALALCLVFVGVWFPAAAEQQAKPIVLGIDAEFGLKNSTSAQSIERGVRTAVEEINQAGGVLGRPLAVAIKDNRSLPARGIDNIKDFAADPDVVAVFGGRFSPVVFEEAPVAQQTGMILLDPWASADGIIDDTLKPNWVFRLSLRDEYAMPTMMSYARDRGLRRVGLLLANTAWGRSNLASAERHLAGSPDMAIVGRAWFNWGEQSLLPQYRQLLAAGAQAVVFVTNDVEGALLIREIAGLPPDERRPVIFHWGITGGTFVEQAGDALRTVDHAVVQTFSFLSARPDRVKKVLATTSRLFGLSTAEQVEAPVGFAHAYDLTHILAKAIALAGTAERGAVRDALERVTNHDGLVRTYARPFAPGHHEALPREQVFMARYRSDGVLAPVGR
ncbi:MAG: ABC transporter substrate-binding protein [Solirubrobacterales bacterium]